MKRLLLLAVLISFCAFGQTPPSGMEGSEFRTWLKQNFYDGQHQTLGYSTARQYMYNDIDNENNSIECVYGGYDQPWTAGGTGTNPMPINCEHTIPQSFFGKSEPMRSDIHHLFPTYSNWNSRRSNYPFAEINDSQTTHWMIETSESSSIPSSNIDAYSEYASQQFEPPEAHKGNVARAVFYFYTMYPSYDMSRVGDINLFYQWHLQDPVDADEIARNEGIFQYQGNRNPFVTNPEYVARAWGFDWSGGGDNGGGDNGGGTGGSTLANGTTVNYSVATNAQSTYTIDLPSGVTSLTVEITGSGDADLYVKRTAINWPGDRGSHDTSEFKAPYASGSNESVTFTNPASGTWNVLIDGYSAASGTITATWQTSGGGGSGTPALQNGVATNFSVAQDATLSYVINVPANVTSMTVTMSGSGGADLYVKRAAINWPGDRGQHDEPEFKAPFLSGTNETVTFTNPAEDTWNVLIFGYRAGSGTITASWQTGGSNTWQYDYSWTRSTPHNYSNNQTYSYTYTQSGASQVGVHFDRLDTEANYDFVRIYDGAGNLMFEESGNRINGGTGSAFGGNDGWAIVAGDTIRVELVTDYSVTDYGFDIDAAAWFP
jgi:endonuclease I